MNKFLLLSLLTAFHCATAQLNSSGGLNFNTKDVELAHRTSLNLTGSGKLPIGKKFTLSFEMAINNPRSFGYIFRLRANEFTASLLFVQFENKDTSYLQLIINDKKIENKIPLPKRNLTKGNWFPVKLVLDRGKLNCSLSINGGPAANTKVNIKEDSQAELLFGIEWEKEEYGNLDVPKMSVRNIKILGKNDKQVHFWPLNESSGLIARDIQSGNDASVLNPNWLINNHFKFNNIARVGPFKNIIFFMAVPIIYSQAQDNFLFFTKDYYLSYDLKNQTTKKVKFASPLQHPGNIVAYNENKNKFYAYYFGRGLVSEYDEKQKAWSHVDTTGESFQHYYFHNSFINPLNGDLCMINGYGWYTYKNILQKYDFIKKKWIRLETKGDYLVPRRYAAICKKNEAGDYFIFGGEGNYSGRQEEGVKNLNDLYLLSMRDTSIRKIGEIKKMPKDFLPYSSMYYDSLKNQLFMMENSKVEGAKASKRLFCYDLSSDTFEVVSDSLNGRNSFGAPIFYSPRYSEIYAFEKVSISADSFYININSLLFPPMTEKEYNKLQKAELSFSFYNKYGIPAFIVIILILGTIVYYFHYRKKQKAEQPALHSITETIKTSKVNSIFLFGNFQVLDKNGKDITKEFSPKLKQLFLLLLTKSYNHSGRGISTDSLSAYLWPDLNLEQTKNNRNVSISKLRTILAHLGKTEIKIDRNMVELSLDENVYCDYLELCKILNSGDSIKEKIHIIKSILSRGEPFQEISYEWFDGQRVHFTEDAISRLKAAVGKNELDDLSKLALADSILFLDSVNQDGLSLKIKAYIALGDHKLARSSYEHFKREYFRLYAEEYSKPFSDFLN
ncbi:MAG: hypothetical protein CVV24_08910 [Ignavibacteriae bacterium HGW-Ignavibacteriae-3]|nr:MAG: hypothetical protein CVV24_08910 [Ignavibacteriae bacterium HGW-Ignavibacteriae-3]